MPIQQLAHHHDEAGRAETALERARLDKGMLHRIEVVALAQPLDGGDAFAIHQLAEIQA